jgi:hypothetical protein
MHRSECLEQSTCATLSLSLHQKNKSQVVVVVAAGTEILSPLCDCVKQVGGRSSRLCLIIK